MSTPSWKAVATVTETAQSLCARLACHETERGHQACLKGAGPWPDSTDGLCSSCAVYWYLAAAYNQAIRLHKIGAD